jgi:hypothetical protein
VQVWALAAEAMEEEAETEETTTTTKAMEMEVIATLEATITMVPLRTNHLPHDQEVTLAGYG